MSRKGGGAAASLQKDVPWRASSSKVIPKIHHSPIVRVPNTPTSNYAISLMKVLTYSPSLCSNQLYMWVFLNIGMFYSNRIR